MPHVTISPTLAIDTDLFTRQRELLAKVAQVICRVPTITIGPEDLDDVIGLESLCDALADSIVDVRVADRAQFADAKIANDTASQQYLPPKDRR